MGRLKSSVVSWVLLFVVFLLMQYDFGEYDSTNTSVGKLLLRKLDRNCATNMQDFTKKYILDIFQKPKNRGIQETKRNLTEQTGTSPEKMIFLIDTTGCQIPEVDPFDNSIKHMIDIDPELLDCPKNDIRPYIQDGILYANLKKVKYSDYYCQYRPIFRDGNEAKFGGKSIKFNTTINISDEFLQVQCFNSSDHLLEETLHFNFIKKNLTHQIQQNSKFRPNILLVHLDSISRINSLRFLPKTRYFLSKTLGAVELLGYNKVAANTMVNVVPFLTGDFVDELPCMTSKEGVDNCPFIWKQFSKRGYYTHFSEDWPYAGIFHLYAAGFKNQPVDYDDRPFHSVNERKSKSDYDACFFGQLTSERLYERIYSLANNLKDERYFSYISHSRLSHDHLGRGVQELDNLTFNALSKLYNNNLLSNTFLAVFGDHGMNFGKVRRTYIGQLEERLPMMFIHVPEWFKSNYTQYTKNLKKNARRLTTHFDMYFTLKHLLDLDKQPLINVKKNKGISLFQEIPINRSCSDAHIGKTWCTCDFHLTAVDNITIQNDLAEALTAHINKILQENFLDCHKLSISTVKSSVKLLQRSKNEPTESHRIVIQTNPGGGIFEATMTYNVERNSYDVTGEINRLNRYAAKSVCVKRGGKVQKYCECKNQ